MRMNVNDELLNENEAGVVLHVATPTLRNWRCKGIGPAYVRLGLRSIRYRPIALQDFIAAGEQATQPSGRPDVQTGADGAK